jgi:hypothetical protein
MRLFGIQELDEAERARLAVSVRQELVSMITAFTADLGQKPRKLSSKA